MIYTFLADISRFDVEGAIWAQSLDGENKKTPHVFEEQKRDRVSSDAFLRSYPAPNLSPAIKEHIEKAKNPSLRAQRGAAYMLLFSVLSQILPTEPEIRWTDGGKPYLSGDEKICFSLSHTEGIVAVSISCGGSPVGVDVEGEVSPERAERLEGRFFSDTQFDLSRQKTEYFFCEMGEGGGFEIYPFSEEKDCFVATGRAGRRAELWDAFSERDFSAKWTLFEASLKCGAEFISRPCIGETILRMSADLKKLRFADKLLYIATATK